MAILICAGLLVLGGVLSAVFISDDVGKVTPDAERPEVEHCYSCPVDGPHLETVRPAAAGSGGTRS